MEKQHLRVIVASEYPQARELMKEIAEEEDGAIFIGQASDAPRTVALARNLRPDVTIVDSNLPYSVGLDNVRLSRMGGLETAQIISEMMPDSCVILITNLEQAVLAEHSQSISAMSFFASEKAGSNTVLKFAEFYQEVLPYHAPVFAHVEVKPWPQIEGESGDIGKEAIHFGTVNLGGGIFLIGTIWLAPFGILLVLVGLASLALGALRKIFSRK